MPDLTNLTQRIDAEFAGFQTQVQQFQQSAKSEYEAREKRFHEQFTPAAGRIVEVIRPRLQVLVERFQDRIKIKPVVTEHLRAVTLKFDSPVARIDLSFRMTHDAEVKNLLLDQQLEILPILMKFDERSSLTMPLDKVDENKIAQWVDDRIVSFIHTVAAVHQNQYYLKDHLVTDPIAGVQLPKYAAKATLDADGKTYYFISDETKAEFEKRRGPGKK
jgi:YHS domain-containing protein